MWFQNRFIWEALIKVSPEWHFSTSVLIDKPGKHTENPQQPCQLMTQKAHKVKSLGWWCNVPYLPGDLPQKVESFLPSSLTFCPFSSQGPNFSSLVESQPKQPLWLYLRLHTWTIYNPLASVHLVVWSSCHKACVKPVVGRDGKEMPIYEGGQCRQNHFYSFEIYTKPRHSIQSQLCSFFWEGWRGPPCILQLIRPSPVIPPPSFLFL